MGGFFPGMLACPCQHRTRAWGQQDNQGDRMGWLEPLARLSLTKSMLHTSLTLVAMFSGVRSAGGRRTFFRLRTVRLAAL